MNRGIEYLVIISWQILTSFPTVPALLSIFTVTYEITSAVLTSVRSVQALNGGGPWRAQRKSLTFLVLREGLIYFGWVFEPRACPEYVVNILNRFITTLSIMSLIFQLVSFVHASQTLAYWRNITNSEAWWVSPFPPFNVLVSWTPAGQPSAWDFLPYVDERLHRAVSINALIFQ